MNGMNTNLRCIFSKWFGCLCFTYVHQVKRHKIDKNDTLDIFIGNNNVSKAYIIFQPEGEKILISRDIHFMESEEWDWDNSRNFVEKTSS